MGTGRARLAASLTTADLSNLVGVIRRLERAGADRLHLDIMDGGAVPTLSFGPDVVPALRRRTRLPLDVHLQVTRPSRFVPALIAGGADSITLPVESDEPEGVLAGSLTLVHGARLGTGLAVNPGTPVSALEPYRALIDVVLIVTSEPGVPGSPFLKAEAYKVERARRLFDGRPIGWEVHVEGGVSRDAADMLGGFGADILVVGSALFRRGHDIAREIRLVKLLADEGWTREIGRGEGPIPRDEWAVVATLPLAEADSLSRSIEGSGIPTLVLRSGPFVPGVEAPRAVLVPATVEAHTRRAFGLGFADEDDL